MSNKNRLTRILTRRAPADGVKHSAPNGSGTVAGVPGGSFRNLRKPTPNEVSVYKCFQFIKPTIGFRRYCERRKMSESLRFWVETESFQNADWKPARLLGWLDHKHVASDIQRHALHIWNHYIHDGAPYQICITPEIESPIFDLIKGRDFHRAMFREAQRHVMRDLNFYFQEYLNQCSSSDTKHLLGLHSAKDCPHHATANVMSNLNEICS